MLMQVQYNIVKSTAHAAENVRLLLIISDVWKKNKDTRNTYFVSQRRVANKLIYESVIMETIVIFPEELCRFNRH